MCLMKLSEEEEKKELRKLKEEFPCWKVIKKSGYCQYDNFDTQPKFTRKVHIAEEHSARRMLLDYPLSFHAYLKKPVLSLYSPNKLKYEVVKCWARKEDINRIGYSPYEFTELLAVAVSRIERR